MSLCVRSTGSTCVRCTEVHWALQCTPGLSSHLRGFKQPKCWGGISERIELDLLRWERKWSLEGQAWNSDAEHQQSLPRPWGQHQVCGLDLQAAFPYPAFFSLAEPKEDLEERAPAPSEASWPSLSLLQPPLGHNMCPETHGGKGLLRPTPALDRKCSRNRSIARSVSEQYPQSSVGAGRGRCHKHAFYFELVISFVE